MAEMPTRIEAQRSKGATRVRKLLGKEVVGSDGNNVGRLHDLALDPGSWQVSELVIRKRRIKLGRKIAIGVGDVASVGDKVLLKNTAESYWK